MTSSEPTKNEAELTVRLAPSVGSFDRDAWNALGGDRNPFVSHEFLTAMEDSGSVGEGTGWDPVPIVIQDAQEQLLAAMPSYAKGHSQGEYVFDHHWASAYERAGGRYFPKLVCAAPFTPVTGPRFLAPSAALRGALASAAASAASQLGVSSLHVNFVNDDDLAIGPGADYLRRDGVQYHWVNRGFETYDDFLATLASRKRKTVRRERRDAANAGLVFKTLRGKEITEPYWDAFWRFYQDTGARKWGHPYLTRRFFTIIADTMTDDLVFFVAERDGTPIAGALNFLGGDAIYGRYWGCTEYYPFLHFELCYHQAIDFAIAHRLARVEAGAQGEHKIARGYEPVATHSLHWIGDAGFRQAIENYLDQERRQNDAEIEYLSDYTPFKKEPSS